MGNQATFSFSVLTSRKHNWHSRLRMPVSPAVWFLCVFLCVLLPHAGRAQDRTYSLSEQERAGTFVGNIARDLNLQALVPAGTFQTLQFSILVYKDGDLFRVDPDNSDLFTKAVLDREVICPYTRQCVLDLWVGARSDTDLQKFSIAVTLLDINDNSPRFNQSSFRLDIPESVTVGKKFPLPGALDDDRGPGNSIQSYSIRPSSGESSDGTFEVESSLKLDGTSDVFLVVSRALDRETRDRYDLVLTARDGGTDPGPREGSMAVSVMVGDDNDHTPVFDQARLVMSACCFIEGSMAVSVMVGDDNDHTPVFDQARYQVQVGENTASGAVIKRLTATDGDIGDNAALRYRLSVHQDASVAQKFAVGAQSGDLTARVALTSGSYTIIVEAVDGGSPERVNQTVVEVTVIDTENNPPAISVDTLNQGSAWAVISEGAKVDALVAHVTVFDPDSGPNGAVLCYSQSAFFDLHPQKDNDYLVVVARTLDREDTPEFKVTLFCEDSGDPKLNDTQVRVDGDAEGILATTTTQKYVRSVQVFDVIVEDVNDNGPVLAGGGDVTVTVRENNTVNDVVTLIEASDADSGDNAALTFSLLDNSEGFFQIPPGSNVLLCARVLDRETRDSHVVRVLVQDGGDPPRSATGTVTVSVQDVNDVAPAFFQARYSFSILENLPAGTPVGTVSAFDLDLGDNGRVDFSIPSWSEGHRKFKMHANGSLVTTSGLDREGVAVHSFMAEVTDRGRPPLSSQVRVEVKVIDQNDNSPVFGFPSSANSTVTVFLPVPAAKSVVLVQATDADEGRNGDLRYSLARQNSSLFSLDPVLGELVAVRQLTTRDVGVYNLTVTATDGGQSPLSTAKKFSVVLKVDPGMEAVTSSDNNAAIAAGLVCGTALLAAAVVAIVCFVRRRDRGGAGKGKSLRYLDRAMEDNSGSPRVLDASQLQGFYDDNKHEPNNNVSLSNGTEPHAKYSVPKLSVGYSTPANQPAKYDFEPMQASPGVRSSLGPGVKGDEVDSRDKELNRVTSLRLQQAFEHISSIKSRLITPSDTSKPYEWREIHIPGHPGDFGSLSSRGTANTNSNTISNGNYNPYTLDSGVGTDDDAVFTINANTTPTNRHRKASGGSSSNKANSHPRLQHHHSTNSYNQYNIHRRNNNNRRDFRSASTTSDRAYRSKFSSPPGSAGFNTMPTSSASSPARHKAHHYRPHHHHNSSSISSTPKRRLFSPPPPAH
ncbi:hypothetical protein EGW08_006688 [Elysia chlorotica]|uniref:Cadherin domain-containing protein n=1 Tax=Elysia chlorotica TaxID=188477 RepID=A0A3S1BPA7_ELYCH|nr:hypothetical protein EGW08_006688 [Elysia chlorotica]